ncbi:pentatricopeptide repeat-containing protein At1g76280 isoform X3 [Brachypodium distachyon]|uniref:pentatricopeptide repeat-containing protein At1g76280 isoform X3 n=1 Tax=Brachypodium distachyon TaxID=15368 RepID=UPI000D0DFC5F|nr:pentatricopeptide repeat-containing protein At1g76280 isoform X3 [Brachypodium distachyon]|eukprot:XP_024316873.1 pentatricopeptide repeat-containing protein At1g76280 isoform X3 [Brachypodium distachyon]
MASLARAAASAAKPLAGRSLGSSLPVPTPARAARILRRSAVARLETLLPLHTPVASARLKSCIAVDSTCWSSLSQEHQDFTWRTSLAARMTQIDIVNALRKGDRQRPSVMLSNLQQTKEALTSEDFSDILEYCAEAPDPLFVMETLELMEENVIGLSKNNYRSVTRALSKGGHMKEGRQTSHNPST